MKKRIILILCCSFLMISGCSIKYQRINFSSDTLDEDLKKHVNENTAVVNNVREVFPTKIPIYKISERKITQQDYEEMLKKLDITHDPTHLELEGNKLFYNLASFVDSSRGYFDMSDEEAERLAWEIFKKIPFIEGEYECLGIKRVMKIQDSDGEHITRAGVSFRKLLDNVRVVGDEDCVLYFDGTGLVAIEITLFNYTEVGTMHMVSLKDAAAKIKTPDDFSIEIENATQAIGVAETLQVDRIKLLLVNQYSQGCTILQPVYNFIGTATDANGVKAEFSSKIIAIPESYTYEAK